MRKIIFGIVIFIFLSQAPFAKSEIKYISRGEAVQMFYDFMSHLPNFKDVDECGPIFKDIPVGHPNCKAVTYVIGLGIAYNCFPSYYRPLQNVSRYEFTAIIKGLIEYMERDYKIKFPYSAETLVKFSDLPDDTKTCEAILGVAEMGIIQGYPSKTTKNMHIDPEMKKPMPLKEAKKYFDIIKSTTEKLLKQKGNK